MRIRGLNLLYIDFSLNGLNVLFIFLVLLVSLFITFYIRYYITNEFRIGLYSLLILVFMGSMLTLLISRN